METDLEHMRSCDLHYPEEHEEAGVRPWIVDGSSTVDVLELQEISEARSTTPSVHGEEPPIPPSEDSGDISVSVHVVGWTNPQDKLVDVYNNEITPNSRLDNRDKARAQSGFASVGGVFPFDKVGGCEDDKHMSMISTSSSLEDASDNFSLIDVMVRVDEETCMYFRCKPDTGADVNIIRERILIRLGRSKESLAPTNLEAQLTAVNKEPLPVLGRIKIVFYVIGMKTPFKAWFYVVPDEHLVPDAILSEKFIKIYGLLSDGVQGMEQARDKFNRSNLNLSGFTPDSDMLEWLHTQNTDKLQTVNLATKLDQPQARNNRVLTVSRDTHNPTQPTLTKLPQKSGIYITEESRQTSQTKAEETTSCLPPSNKIQERKESAETLGQRVPSDSGYHSGVGTDTESVCSLSSVGSSLGLTQDFLQDFIAFFGDTLIERASVRTWAECAWAQHSPDIIEQRLNALLKDYAAELLGSREDHSNQAKIFDEIQRRIASGAAYLVRRYRPNVARYVRENAVSTPLSSMSMASRLQKLGKQLSTAEKLALIQQNVADAKDAAITTIDSDAKHKIKEECDYGEETDESEYLAYLTPIRDFLVSGEAFQNLAVAMRRNLYSDEGTGMDRIKQQILQVLSGAPTVNPPNVSNSQARDSNTGSPEPSYYSQFYITWGAEEFLYSQFGSSVPLIGSLVALTGSAFYAQATTCEEYMRTTWPNTGLFFLSSLQSIFESSQRLDLEEHKYMTYDSDNLHLLVTHFGKAHAREFDADSLLIVALGTKEALIDLAQQISWIGAVLSSSPFDENLAYCRAVIRGNGKGTPTFNISFDFGKLHPAENPCWLPLFCGACIARDFPIPERQGEMGLEIPLQLMSGIAGVRHAVEYEGGVVMKGFSSMFIPIKRNGDRVQWHLVSSPTCETRLTYQDALRRCPQRVSLDQVGLESLHTTRAIIGWCSPVSCLLGSNKVSYEDIHYSGAGNADTGMKFAGGTVGLQQFGVAQLDFTFGLKDGKCHFQRNGPFQRIVSAAEKSFIVLYDKGEKRAWLVKASEVMLHLAHSRNCLEPFKIKGKCIRLPTIDQDGLSTQDILLRNAPMDLSDYEKYTFKDMVLNIWSILEFLIDQNVRRDQTPGAIIKGTLRDSLQGFEFKAVAEERSPYRLKDTPIEKTSGGWPALVRDIDALVLFADGFNDIMQPLLIDDGQQLCRRWRTVPKEKDYLATSVKIVKELYNVAGCRLSRSYLSSSQLQWHRGQATLFEPCKSPGSYRCECSRVQQIMPKSAIGQIASPGKLDDDGAVIFGQSESALQELMKTPSKPRQSGIYSQPNVSIDIPALMDQIEYDSCPDNWPKNGIAPQNHSDTTESTVASFITSSSNGVSARAQRIL